jgi:hypothetical protein
LTSDEFRWSPTEGDENPGETAYFSLLRAVRTGSTRSGLQAIRDRLAEELQDAEGRDVAQLGLALLKVMEAIEKVPDLQAADPANEIAQRRERRLREARSARPRETG